MFIYSTFKSVLGEIMCSMGEDAFGDGVIIHDNNCSYEMELFTYAILLKLAILGPYMHHSLVTCQGMFGTSTLHIIEMLSIIQSRTLLKPY